MEWLNGACGRWQTRRNQSNAGLIALAMLGLPIASAARAAEPIPVRVVVVTMFEQGSDSGDALGELLPWVKGLPAKEMLPFPLGERALSYNSEKRVLLVNTGVGTAKAASSITALGLDPRFDFTKSYWLVAGIGGANPNTAPLASAVWVDWVVDGDLAYEIDARQIPSDWATGYVPIFQTKPYQEPQAKEELGNVYRLNPTLADWAYGLTGTIALPDPPGLDAWRAHYAGHAAATKEPTVMKGSVLAASTFWHGSLMNDWATDWVNYWTGDAGTFAVSAMEDSGTLAAMTRLAKAGRVDLDRVLILRTTSNFMMEYDGVTAAESLATEGTDYSAFGPALDAAFSVGSAVVDALVDGWAEYEETVPGG